MLFIRQRINWIKEIKIGEHCRFFSDEYKRPFTKIKTLKGLIFYTIYLLGPLRALIQK